MSIQLVKHERRLVVLDIDGCLIDSFDRLPHLLQGDRETYDKLHPTDRVIPAGQMIYQMLLRWNAQFDCVFITSRSACAREYTLNQLTAALNLSRSEITLLMREVGCDEPDVVLKPRLLAEAGYDPEDVLLVVEDSATMNAHWRSLGITCWQTLPNGV